jgi:hypothetical protein
MEIDRELNQLWPTRYKKSLTQRAYLDIKSRLCNSDKGSLSESYLRRVARGGETRESVKMTMCLFMRSRDRRA